MFIYSARDRMNIVESIFDSLENWGTHPVLKEAGSPGNERFLDSDGFRLAVESTAARLTAMGVVPGSPVPLFLENSLEFPICFLALIRIGAIPVMVRLYYRSRELSSIFENLNPRVVITEKNHLPIISPWLKKCLVIVREKGSFSVAQTGEEPCIPIEIPDEVATINYTYRGYGYPLGAMATHGQYLEGARAFFTCLKGAPGEKMLVTLPYSHIFTLVGCLIVPLMEGITPVVSRTMNPRGLFDIIEKERITHMLAIPELYDLLGRLKKEENDLSSLQVFISGGSQLTPDQHRKFSEMFSAEVIHGYGLTEFTPAFSNRRGEVRPGTIGVACDGVGFSLAEDGEILLDTPHITRGYYRREKETREAFDNGLFRTGDIGKVEDGHLVFVKEKKRTRKINGNIVDLTEIEDAIRDFPATDKFQVDYADGRLTAHVSFSGDDAVNKERLRDYLIESIARFKVPQILIREKI